MNVKLCDNCNEIAGIEDQYCITMDLPYRNSKHFCDENCLREYLEKLNKHEISSKEEELRDKIIDIIGNENIEKIHEMISNATHIDMSIERRCIYKILIDLFLE